VRVAFDRGTAGTAGTFAEGVGEAGPRCVERPVGASDGVTESEAGKGTELWLASAASLPVCAMELAFERGAAGNASIFAETVGEVAVSRIERPKETAGSGTAGDADCGAWLWLASAASLPVCVVRVAFDGRTAANAGRLADTVGEAVARCIERPKKTSGRVTAGEADVGTGLWLVSAALLSVCAVRFAFDCGIAGTASRFAETVGEVVSHCIERPTETPDSVVAGEADGGTELWLASALPLPVCAVRFAFDCRIAGTASRFAETVGEVAPHCIEWPKETFDGWPAGEAGEGVWLWLALAALLPVCAIRFAFDRGIAGTAD